MKQGCRYLLLLFACTISFSLHGQVKMEGSFSLGDTSQTHLLFTASGNLLQGRVLGFDPKKIMFLWADSILLTFPVAQVKSISVKEAPNSQAPRWVWQTDGTDTLPVYDFGATRFLYRASETGEEDFVGHLETYNRSLLRFRDEEGSLQVIRQNAFVRMELISPPVAGKTVKGQRLHVLHTKPRNDRFVGQVLYADDSVWQFQTTSGAIIQFPFNEVESINYQEPEKKLKDEMAEQARSVKGFNRIFLTPSGFLAPKGNHEYSNIELFYNAVNFGVDEHINLEVGVVPLIFLNIGHLNLKFAGSLTEYMQLGIGAQLTGINLILSENQLIRMIYGVTSIGVKERYINLGVSRGGSNYGDPFTAISIGGAVMMGSKVRLVSEYIRIDQPQEQTTVFNALLQIVSKKFRFEFGVMAVPGESVGIPLLGFHVLL